MKTVCVTGDDGAGKTTIIKKVVEELKGNGHHIDIISSTTAIRGVLETFHYRSVLVDPNSSNKDRFHAALSLWLANFNHYFQQRAGQKPADLLIIDRGSSGFITYQKVESWTTAFQTLLIPRCDYDIYVTAPFVEMTGRIATRDHGRTWQDENAELRRHVYMFGVKDYEEYCQQRGQPMCIIHNTDGNIDMAVNQFINFLDIKESQ